ncbi:hypothetical protein [Parasporobacterium paucivorans]|uniref:FlgN protein n=1 Tax=Parasporobacterium paucivorans DSM 15970 TaxID=1122934 RepID=A0A1M6I6K0_9FIRM|nr:hypothetical protein [Parasporobacterium paucivorans]SHJ30055.1 hypothetical protein SAMN02745691_01693 [Parasporobacterium paucivorans DSM 15970]
MYTFSDFLKILEEMILFFSEAAAVEMQKLHAVGKERLSFLEDCMKKEQVMILKLRGFDRKRESIQEALGYKGFSLKQVSAACSPQERELLLPLMEQLDQNVLLFTNTLDNARSLMEVSLHKVNTALSQGYTQMGVPAISTTPFTNHTI